MNKKTELQKLIEELNRLNDIEQIIELKRQIYEKTNRLQQLKLLPNVKKDKKEEPKKKDTLDFKFTFRKKKPKKVDDGVIELDDF